MSTIDITSISENNKNLARTINDLGEILHREDYNLYQQLVTMFFTDLEIITDDVIHEKEILLLLYNNILDLLKIIRFNN
jgi:hypothetical protein